MRVRVDAGRQTQQNRLRFPFLSGNAVERKQLVLVINDKGAHPDVQRVSDVRVGLVVAVKIDVRRIKSRLAGRVQLAGRNDIRSHLLRCGDAVDVHVRQRLRGEQHAAACREAFPQQRGKALHIAADFPLVNDVKRRAVFLRERDSVAAADEKTSVFTDGIIVV